MLYTKQNWFKLEVM